MSSQKYQEVFHLLISRSDLALKLYGMESEQYTTILEDEILFYKEAQQFNLAMPKLERLIRILKDIHGGENNQKVLQCYQNMMDMQFATAMLSEALLTVQKKISIYKALNGNDVVDKVLIQYIVELGALHQKLKKNDDAIRNLNEGLKLCKQLLQRQPDQEIKDYETEINKLIEQYKKEGTSVKGSKVQSKKSLKQSLIPDSPLKIALWATFFAGVAGLTAYAIMKKKN